MNVGGSFGQVWGNCVFFPAGFSCPGLCMSPAQLLDTLAYYGVWERTYILSCRCWERDIVHDYVWERYPREERKSENEASTSARPLYLYALQARTCGERQNCWRKSWQPTTYGERHRYSEPSLPTYVRLVDRLAPLVQQSRWRWEALL